MNCTEFNNFVLKKNSYFLPNNTIDAYKIKHQPKAEMFVQDCDNLIKNKLK